MKTRAGHTSLYSSEFEAVNFFFNLNPTGAINFCVYLLRGFGRSSTTPYNLFTNIHQKFDTHRMDEFREFKAL